MAFVIVLKILTHLFSSLKFFINTVFDVKFPIPVKSLLSNIKIGQIYWKSKTELVELAEPKINFLA